MTNKNRLHKQWSTILTFIFCEYIDVSFLFKEQTELLQPMLMALRCALSELSSRAFCLFFPFHALSDLFRTHFIFELRKTFNLSPRKRELIRARVSAIIFHRKWSKVSNKRAWSRRMRVHHFDIWSPLWVQLLLLLLWKSEDAVVAILLLF